MVPLVIQLTVGDVVFPQEDPHLLKRPIQNGIEAEHYGVALISQAYLFKLILIDFR